MLREFLNPRHWAPSVNREFAFNYDQVRRAGGIWSGRLVCAMASLGGSASIATLPRVPVNLLPNLQICQLCDQAERIFQSEPSVLKLRGAAFAEWMCWLLPGMLSRCLQHTGPAALPLKRLTPPLPTRSTHQDLWRPARPVWRPDAAV